MYAPPASETLRPLPLLPFSVHLYTSPSLFRFQKPFRVYSRHTPGPRRGYGLPVDMVLNVAGGKDPGNVGLCAIVRLEIADFVHLELAAEKRGVGLVADADEHSVTRLYGFFSLHHVLDFHPGYRALRRVQNVRDHRIPDELDLLVAPHPVLHDLGGPQLVTTVNDRNLGGIAGEEQRLFRRRVTATHNHDGL